MAKAFDPAKLFEPWRYRPNPKLKAFGDHASTLDAVRDRKKGMCMFSSQVGALAPPDSEINEWLRDASGRDLLVVLNVERVPGWKLDRQPVRIFLSRPEELWRIPAFLGLWETAFAAGRWSDGAENMMSMLLGYTEKQRKAWLEVMRQDRAAWGCETVYALLTKTQASQVESLGRRCFGPSEALDNLVLFFHRGNELKRDAKQLVPKDRTLARVGLGWREFHLLFGPFEKMKKRGVISKPVPKDLAPAISAGFVSNVQFLTRTGWK